MDKSQRLFGLDLIRMTAVVLVFHTHALAYLGVGPVTPGWPGWLCLRYLAVTCVPLFLLLTGYLSGRRELTLRYYGGLISVLISYVAISALAEVMHRVYFHLDVSPTHILFHILNYTANGYAWYVEMYIGLFFLIPFLNLLWRALDSRGKRQALIATLALFTMLPPVVESFGSAATRLDIIPDYWREAYPLTYYFLGAYLREYRPRPGRGKTFVLLALTVSLSALWRWQVSTPENDAGYILNGFGCLTTGVAAVLLFLLMYDLDCKSRPVRAVVTELSVCSFEIYLCSYLTDRLLYTNWKGPLPVTVLISLTAAWLMARVLRLGLVPLSRRLAGLYSGLCDRLGRDRTRT